LGVLLALSSRPVITTAANEEYSVRQPPAGVKPAPPQAVRFSPPARRDAQSGN
jgi:hypothetical protein